VAGCCGQEKEGWVGEPPTRQAEAAAAPAHRLARLEALRASRRAAASLERSFHFFFLSFPRQEKGVLDFQPFFFFFFFLPPLQVWRDTHPRVCVYERYTRDVCCLWFRLFEENRARCRALKSFATRKMTPHIFGGRSC
jgi:hypothetical protein